MKREFEPLQAHLIYFSFLPVHAASDVDHDDDGSDEGDDGDDGDYDLGCGSSARALMPLEYAVTRMYGWPWRSGGFHEQEAILEVQQRMPIRITRYV